MNRIVASLALAFAALAPLPSQTVRVVLTPDQALLITTLPKCTMACPDSARLTFLVGARTITKVVKSKAVDTVAIARANAGTRGAVFTYTPYKGAAAKQIALWKTDSLFEFTRADGTQITGSATLEEGEALRGVFVIVHPDLTRSRPTTPVEWVSRGPAMMYRRTNGNLADTVWFLAVKTP